MHTQIHIPPAVQLLRRSQIHVCVRPATIKWFKRHAHKRQRRYMRQMMKKFCHEPERFDGEGFRGLPRPLSSWDID